MKPVREMVQMKRALGLSLIELLVAIAIGSIVVAAVGFVYIGSRQTFRAQDVMARMQENARYAYDTMAQDIRLAGLTGCSVKHTAVVDNLGNASWYGGFVTRPLTGYESGVGGTGIANALANRDALTVLRAENTREFIVTAHAGQTFTLSAAHDIDDGDVLVACDPGSLIAAQFQATNPNGNNIDSVNATAAFNAGSRLMKLSGNTYFVRNNAAGEPSLYRQRLKAQGGAPTSEAEEVVEGVENMQITYGVDTDVAADGQVNAYQTADEIENGTGVPVVPGADAVARWQRVLSVRISLLMVSRASETGVVNQPQSYAYNGAAVAAGDRLLRQVFTFVVAVRNRP